MEVLGIDIGGSGIKGAIVNIETGVLCSEKHRIPTPKGAKPKDIADVVAALIKHFNWNGQVGCGFPTIVHHGKALHYSNLHKSWKGLQIDTFFRERTGLPFTVINDADAAGLATIHFGTSKGKNGLILMITVGTGLGSGLFYNGQLIPNFELGKIPYKSYKYIETYAADSARKREALSLKEWAQRFNKFLKIVERLILADLIIIGGGASKKFDQFKHLITIDTPVIAAMHQNNAGIIGAALGAVKES